MYLILMVYACLISCSLINKSKCHSLAYFNLRWTCVVILHKYIYIYIHIYIYIYIYIYMDYVCWAQLHYSFPLRNCLSLVITENLTKQQMELLQKARTVDGVKSTWAIDGRIICLLTSGRKETIVHNRDLVNLRELCRQ